MMVSVLCTREKSVYDELGADTWPASRDIRKYEGGRRVVAHPPCRGWGKFKQWSKHNEDELDLARLCVQHVRRDGGVLEHPVGSGLWPDQNLPLVGGLPDEYGGFTTRVYQCDFGHRALKPTLLYCVGVDRQLASWRPPPQMPKTTVEKLCRAERERTPIFFARYLLDLASSY